MKTFRKKIMFLEMSLIYVIILLALTGSGRGTATPESLEVSGIYRDSEDGEKPDPYQDEKKKVALTFDDGPDAVYTPKLLDGLEERKVKATFFLLGKQAERYPDIVKRIHEEGHLVGTHSYEHVNLCTVSEKEAIRQVLKTNELIQELTDEYPQYIRPPYGCWSRKLDNKIGMIEVDWDIDPLDWNRSNSRVIAKLVTDKVQEGDIILMHDASDSSVKAAFQIIDTLKKQGYEFVTVEAIVGE